MPDAISLADIERLMQKKTYGMIAIDTENRGKMIQIIAEVLDLAGGISPLLEPLVLKEKLLKEAAISAKEKRFEDTIKIFEQLAEIASELGDDTESHNFLKRADKLKSLYLDTKDVKETYLKPQVVNPSNSKSSTNDSTPAASPPPPPPPPPPSS